MLLGRVYDGNAVIAVIHDLPSTLIEFPWHR